MIPYNLTNEMTDQEIFNIVWKHFIIDKNPRSISGDGSLNPKCRYRNPQGNACAVGIFLDDETAKKFDGVGGIYRCIDQFEHDKCVNVLVKHRHLLADLQTCHDSVVTNSFEKNLRNLAEQLGLTVPE